MDNAQALEAPEVPSPDEAVRHGHGQFAAHHQASRRRGGHRDV